MDKNKQSKTTPIREIIHRQSRFVGNVMKRKKHSNFVTNGKFDEEWTKGCLNASTTWSKRDRTHRLDLRLWSEIASHGCPLLQTRSMMIIKCFNVIIVVERMEVVLNFVSYISAQVRRGNQLAVQNPLQQTVDQCPKGRAHKTARC